MRRLRWVIGLAALGVPLLLLWQFQLCGGKRRPARHSTGGADLNWHLVMPYSMMAERNDADEAVRIVNPSPAHEPGRLEAWRRQHDR